MKIVLNEGVGLNKGTSVMAGGRQLDVTVLNVLESRQAWVKLLPWIKGMMMAEELPEEGALGPVAMASVAGALSEETFNFLVELFAKRTSFEVVERANSGNDVTSKRFLSEKGVLDNIFAGCFEDLISWLDVCIQLNFGAQISKLYGALVANGSRMTTNTVPSDLSAPKAKPSEFV